jgi:hypothetical protein
MFGLWKRWRRRKAARARALFTYWDGRKWRYTDPFLAWRRLDNHKTLSLDSMAPLADAGKEPETTIMVETLCEVFNVTRWDETMATGLTDWQVLNLLVELLAYFQSLKKSISLGPTLPEPTDLESSTPPEVQD